MRFTYASIRIAHAVCAVIYFILDITMGCGFWCLIYFYNYGIQVVTAACLFTIFNKGMLLLC